MNYSRILILFLFAFSLSFNAFAQDSATDTQQPVVAEDESSDGASKAQSSMAIENDATVEEMPWDYDPYRVLVWYTSDNAEIHLSDLEQPLRSYLSRDFDAVWRVDFAEAPNAVATAAKRDISNLTYESITAADPVLAVKRDHPDAVRIRVAKNVGTYVKKVYANEARIREVLGRSSALGNETFSGISEKLEAVIGDEFAVRDLWNQSEPLNRETSPKATPGEETASQGEGAEEAESGEGKGIEEEAKPEREQIEAVIVSRGLASTLEPEAKLIVPDIAGLVGETVENYDKVFIVSVTTSQLPMKVQVVEFDTLMRHFGPVASVDAANAAFLPRAIGIGLTRAFGPMVRIENAGLRSALGLVRAGGLVIEEDREHSPAWIRVGDVLEPMTRKNDRNGNPIMIGPLDWAFLHVKELDGYQNRNVQMDFYSGRGGGLQGRKNKRTFKTALKVRPELASTEMRLHLQRDPDFPLIGYELYQKDLDTGDMTFVGRTNWNGILKVEPTEDPLRLLYVKNGGAILARLPLVPGLYSQVVADLSGDDIRLQAEAYIRGAQNSIIDLVAIRELFKARVLLRLEQGQMEKAGDLLTALKDQPGSDELYGAIGKKQQEFINLLGNKNANQSRKVDEMFSTTRDLLQKHITPKLIEELDLAYIEAEKNGGKLPARPKKPKVDNSADAKPKDGGDTKPASEG